MSLVGWLKRRASRSRGAIDKAKYHYGNGAATEQDGAYHIGFFLRFCAERKLAARQHEERLEQLVADPARYLIRHCAAMLCRSDLTPEGVAFAEQVYDKYLMELADIAMLCGREAYALRSDPDRTAVEELVLQYLDRRLSSTGGQRRA